MEIKALPYDFTVCQLDLGSIDTGLLAGCREFWFASKTDEEFSLVCLTSDVPTSVIAREDGWKAMRICGVLDFSLIGILSNVTGILAEQGIGIFAVSTYNTDYIMVKSENFERALNALSEASYRIVK